MRSASTVACGEAGVTTTSLLTVAKADSSALITYLPREGKVSVYDPSGAVALAIFLPVSVFEAVTATPGSGVFDDLIIPRTTKGTGVTGAAGAGGVEATTACAAAGAGTVV